MKNITETSQPLRLLSASKRDVRAQFGALCWRIAKGKMQICLVTSRRTRRWIVPKGWLIDGATPAEAAATEAMEEAGLAGRIDEACIGIYTYQKEIEGEEDIPCLVAIFPLKVKEVRKDWPERAERRRRWFSRKEAARRVREPELARIIHNFDPRPPSGP